MTSVQFARAAVVLAVSLASSGMAAARGPSAVVEDVSGGPAGVEFMDYVSPGQIVNLGTRGVIVLGYLRSCVRESIVGGTVTIGRQHSEVKGGQMTRSTVPCSGERIQLSSQQSNQSAAMVFRRGPNQRSPSGARPQLTIFNLSPLIEARGGEKLSVTRIDRSGENVEIEIESGKLVRGVFYDFKIAGQLLTAGGTYRASLDGQSIVFKVDEQATANHTPIVSRLIRFKAGDRASR
jgi:hypothetical protein